MLAGTGSAVDTRQVDTCRSALSESYCREGAVEEYRGTTRQ